MWEMETGLELPLEVPMQPIHRTLRGKWPGVMMSLSPVCTKSSKRADSNWHTLPWKSEPGPVWTSQQPPPGGQIQLPSPMRGQVTSSLGAFYPPAGVKKKKKTGSSRWASQPPGLDFKALPGLWRQERGREVFTPGTKH